MNLQLFMLEHTSPPELLCRNKANENGFAQIGRDTGRTAEVLGQEHHAVEQEQCPHHLKDGLVRCQNQQIL
jgi:hypothetical protein